VTRPTADLLVLEQLGEWASQWDHLVDQSPLPSPFLRSWWLTGSAGPHPCFLLAVQEGQLLGGLALEAGRRMGMPCLRMMSAGALCPDHLDLLAAPGQEETVVKAIHTWLCRPGSRLLDLEGVVTTGKLVTALPGGATCESIAVAPWTPIPADAEAYFAARPALFRRNLRRASARLASAGATHRASRGSSAIQRLDVLRQLHHAQWGERSNFLPRFDRFAASCGLAIDFDEICIHELIADQTVLAILVAFEVVGRLSLYQSARLTDSRWREASTVLLAAVITDACERGLTEVDFLRGGEAYKRNFAPHRREVARVTVANGSLGRLAMITHQATRKAKAPAASVAHWSGLSQARRRRDVTDARRVGDWRA
jgi:CelD/BcsL family acetyltransferase involved in cellulose biosynthesis